MRIAIFGATGLTGQILLQQALAENFNVTAFARSPDKIAIRHEQLQLVQGDILDETAVEQAIAQQDALISVIGVPFTFKPVDIYSQGLRNILAAMQKQGVQRLLSVSSGGSNPAYDPHLDPFFNLVFKRTIARTAYEDMRRAEQLLQQSPVDWTVVRPSLLNNRSASPAGYRIAEGYTLPKGLHTSRADLADFLLKNVATTLYQRQAVAIASKPKR